MSKEFFGPFKFLANSLRTKNITVTETPNIGKTISVEKNLDLIFSCNSNLDEKTISQQLDTNLNETQYIKFRYFDSNIVT